MSTSVVVLLTGLAPLSALGLALERTRVRFSPPPADEAEDYSWVDVRARRLAEAIDRAADNAAAGSPVMRTAVAALRPSIERALTGERTDPSLRARLERHLQGFRPADGITSIAALDELLSDLERP